MSYAREVIDQAKTKYKHQPEFIQTVEEILLSLEDFLEKNPKYKENRILERLLEPERIISFRVVWERDNGQIEVNKGYRVQFNSAIGPYKGGLRFDPSVNESILKFLGFEQTFKNALTSIPMGGGKGGSDFDPKGKTDTEVMRFCQAFISELHKYIGFDVDVPAGDMGVGGRKIGYMFGQYKKLSGGFNGVFTGKGFSFGGSLLRPEATGFGLLYFVQNMLERINDKLEGKRILVSGSGNVAQFAVKKALELGGKVLTMSDSDGYIYDSEGIDEQKLEFVMEIKNVKRGRISEYVTKYPNAKFFKDKNPWSEKADIALPCATQNEIEEKDAKSLIENGIKIVAEGSNMSSTNAAIMQFLENKILYSPGKASNAGGVAVSGLEMSQNAMHTQWNADTVDSNLKEIMQSIHSQCVKDGLEGDFVNYVKGANISGFKKVAEAMLAQGLV